MSRIDAGFLEMRQRYQRQPAIATPFNAKESSRPCCYCGKPRPRGRRRWCSDVCVIDYQVRKGDANVIRRELQKRDDGVCGRCGMDTKLLGRVLWHLSWDHRDADRFLRRQLEIHSRYTLWDADHIVPVSEGGGGCGLDGYRTLCLWCHRGETSALAKRTARNRRDDKRPLLALMEA